MVKQFEATLIGLCQIDHGCVKGFRTFSAIYFHIFLFLLAVL